jgi:hypothetical protein
MSVKPDVPTHPDSGLNERSSSSDKQGAIERYYELLSSGHSVGGTLNTIVPIQSKSEDGDAVAVELPQSRIDETATDVAPEIALAGRQPKEAGRSRVPSVLISHGVESFSTEEPQAAENASLNELGSDNREQLLRESLPESESDTVKSVGSYIYAGRKEAIRSSDQKRLRSNKFPRVRRRIAFGALYVVIAVFISIVGFSIMRSGRNAESTYAQLDTSNRTEATTIQAPAGGGLEIEDQKLQKQVANADSSQASKPSKPAEPGLVVPGTLQSLAVGVRETDSAAQREVGLPQRSSAGQVNTAQQSTHQATAPRDPAHEPILSIAQSLSASQGSAEAPSHPDTGQPLEATPKDEPKVTATAPTRNVSAELLSRAHASKRRKASTPHRDTGSRRYIHRQVPAKYP